MCFQNFYNLLTRRRIIDTLILWIFVHTIILYNGKAIKMDFRFIRNRHFFIIDILMGLLAYVAIIAVIAPLSAIITYIEGGIFAIILLTTICPVVFAICGIYQIDWIYASYSDYAKLLCVGIFSAIINIFIGFLIKNGYIFPKLNVAANACIIMLVCSVRFFVRLLYKYMFSKKNNHDKRALIIGAGSLAVTLLREINTNPHMSYNVVGLIDDEKLKYKKRFYGVNVLGTRNDIVRICKEKGIDEIIFAIYNLPYQQRQQILDICASTGCKVKILPGIEAMLTGKITSNTIREVEIEDLLERDPVTLDNKQIANDIAGKTVLVTGGGGSIGSELCRQILKYRPAKLIVVDIYENTAYELSLELKKKYPKQDIDTIIASIRDEERLEKIFSTYKPDMVFHAAAHKHVPLMEKSPSEAIKNNVFGTYNVALYAQKYGVERFIMISTDKAVNPTNIMGASKRMCEMIIQTFAKEGKTKFVAVRFGNVLGSNGSVIPLFKRQIKDGGPVTVTHPEITRFFMTIPEAAQLVLQAASYAQGGEIFVLDMGEPVKIYDLARKLISLSGYKPDADIKIEFTGLRPGEKLYEELLMDEEGLNKTAHSKIFVGQPIDIDVDILNQKLEVLKAALEKDDDAAIKTAVAEVVPTYTIDENYA